MQSEKESVFVLFLGFLETENHGKSLSLKRYRRCDRYRHCRRCCRCCLI